MVSMEKEKTTPLGKSEREEPERFIPDGMGMFQRNVKRIGDCALAFLALIVFSPLFLLCYIAVKQEDGARRSLGKSVSVVSVARSTSISSAVCVWTRRSSVRPLQGWGRSPDNPCRKIPPGTSLGRAAPVMECLRGRHVLYRSPSRA